MSKLEKNSYNKVNKAWGYELIIENNEHYCGKILHFNESARFSLHFHMKKTETWYVQKGIFVLTYIDTTSADKEQITLMEGDVIKINPGVPHQLSTAVGGDIYEISTQHFDDDSYRVEKGDSQK